jgi:hypothetical protein
MRMLIRACAIVVAIGGTAAAQDRTATSKLTVKGDDVKTVMMRGCLVHGAGNVFLLSGAIAAAGDDLKAETRTKTDVDDHGQTVKEKTTTKIDKDDAKIVRTGPRTTYEVISRGGVELLPYVGRQVELAALIVDPAKGDDDAKVKIKEETKVDREDAPDSKEKTETKLEIPRSANARLTAVSVRQIAPACLP